MGFRLSFANGRAHGSLAAVIGIAFVAALAPASAGAAVSSNPKPDATSVANAIAADPSRVVGASFVGQQYTGAPGPVGLGDSELAGFPRAGSSFAVMTSGNAEFADDPNSSTSTGRQNGIGPPVLEHGTKAFDYTVLKVDVVVPSSANCVGFDFRFLSEEFPEYVNKGYNDAFLAEVDQTTWVANAEQGLVAPDDIAASSGDVVSVDTLGPTAMSAGQSAGTTYDGSTDLLSARAKITPGKHSIYFSVLDFGDASFDSAVFLDNLRFTNELAGTCSFSGSSDEVPPGLIVCGPVGTVLPPCGGLLPPPRPLVVCGPSSGTILQSCEGLALGFGPKPFIGDAAWDPIEVKCDDSGGECNVDVDAQLAIEDNRELTKFGGKPGVRPEKSAKNAIKLAIGGLSESSYDLFDAARSLADVSGQLQGASGEWLSSVLGELNGDLVEGFGVDNDLIGLGQQSLEGITGDSLRDYDAVLAEALDGLGGVNPLLALQPKPAEKIAKSLVNEDAALLDQIQAGQQKTSGLLGSLRGLLPTLPPGMGDALQQSIDQVGQLTSSMKPDFNELLGAVGQGSQSKWNAGLQGLLDGQAADFQRMVGLLNQQNDLVGQIVGRAGATTPPGDQAAAVGGIGGLIHTLFVNNQLTSTLFMNGAALDGLIDGTKGPDQKLTPALVGGFSAPASRMLSGLLGGGQLGGLLQEAASLQFPMSGTQTMVDDLNPSNIGSGAQLQQLQATMSQLDAFFGQMSAIMKTVSTLSTQAAINPLNPRPLAKPQAKKPKKLDVDLGSTQALLAPGETASLGLALTQRARKVLKTARKKHVKRLTARVHVRALDASGARVEQTFKVKVGNGKPAKGE